MQVIGNGVLGRASEDRMIQPDHLPTGSQSEKIIEDDSIYWNLENAENWLPMDNFQCTSDFYNQEVDYSAYHTLHVDTAQILEKDMKYEFVDRMLQRVNDKRDLHFTCNLPNFRSDHLLDSVYQESMSNGLSSDLKRSKGQTEYISRDDDVSEISNSPSAAIPVVEYTSDQSSLFLDNMDDQDLHDAFRSRFGQDTHVMDKQWLKRQILFGLQNLGKMYNVSGNVESGLLSTENEDILIPGSHHCERVCTSSTDTCDRKLLMVSRDIRMGGHSRKNSQRTTNEVTRVGPRHGLSRSSVGGTARCKPTRRFTEEMPEMKSSYQNEESHVQRGRPRKTSIVPESESLDDLSDSAAEIKIKKIRHKWTFQEVVKLVDGVSLYGVGNWREIKRELFLISDFRTPVDLKDKWRNLLKASAVQQRNRNEDSVHKFRIPKSVLQRVRELSAMQTYPREQKSRLTSTAASSSIMCVAAAPSINCIDGAL